MTNGEKIKEIFPNMEISPNPYSPSVDICVGGIMMMRVDRNWWNADYKEPTTKNDLAQERYQDLIEYFGDEKVATTILESRKEFKAQLERLRWNVKKVDELARKLEQIKGTTKKDLGVDCISREQALEPYKILENTDTLSVYTIRQNLAELPSMGRYDPYTDKFIKNTTIGRVEIGTDGNLYRLSISNGNEFLPMDKLYTTDEVIAMLTEIQSEIKTKSYYDTTIIGNYEDEVRIDLVELDDVNDIIQKKIDNLKGETK